MLQMVGCKYTVFLLLKIGHSFTEALKPSLPPRRRERTWQNPPKKTAVTLPPIEPTTGGRVNRPVPRKSHLGGKSRPFTGRVSHPLTSLFFTGRIFHRQSGLRVPKRVETNIWVEFRPDVKYPSEPGKVVLFIDRCQPRAVL